MTAALVVLVSWVLLSVPVSLATAAVLKGRSHTTLRYPAPALQPARANTPRRSQLAGS